MNPDPKDLMKMLASMMSGGKPSDPAVKEKVEAFEKCIDRQYAQFCRDAFANGVTAVTKNSQVMGCPQHGIRDIHYNEEEGFVDSVKEHLDLGPMFDIQFNPNSDGELYSEAQMKPQGFSASIVCAITPVSLQVSPTFSLGKKKDDEEYDPFKFAEYWLATYYLLLDKKRNPGSLHWDYQARIVARQEFTSEEFYNNTSFNIPAMPVNLESTLEFFESLVFMDEDPESGG